MTNVPYYVSWEEYRGVARRHIAPRIGAHSDVGAIYAVPNGGTHLAADIGRLFKMPIRCIDPRGRRRFGRIGTKYMIVDDIIDTGRTMERIVSRCNSRNLVIVSLYVTSKNRDRYADGIFGEVIPDDHSWIIFPWESLRTLE